MNTCIRIYYNGEFRVTNWNSKETEEWVDYNSVMRFGNALFVNGKCRGNGYFSEAECKILEEAISCANNIKSPYHVHIKAAIKRILEIKESTRIFESQ